MRRKKLKCILLIFFLGYLCFLPQFLCGQTINRQFPSETLIQRLTSLHAVSGCIITFDSKQLKGISVPAFNAKNANVEQILTHSLAQTNFTYKKVDAKIFTIIAEDSLPKQGDFPTIELRGKVVDSENVPIIGASVVVKGTTMGMATDVNGGFSIRMPQNATITVSYIGFITKELKASDIQNETIVLKEDTQSLDEIVVIGYGTIKKIDLTGSVAGVDGEKLASIQATSVSQALQGMIPGVQVTRSSSMPGASASIRVRGITTIGTSDPLILVDGIQGSLGLDVDDIESISVLKDAASASIYGARASAGVILITTKRAKEGELSIDYSGTLGFLQATTFPGVVDYKRFMEMHNETSWNDSGNIPGSEYFTYSQDFIESYAENNRLDPDRYPITDWKSYLINDFAPRQKHNLSINYGNKVFQSKASIGYEKTDALYNHRSYATIIARINNNLRINKYLAATVDGYYRRGISENATVNPMEASYKLSPIYAPLFSDGRITGAREGSNTYARLNYGGFNNSWSDYFTGKIALDFTPLKGLTITGVYAPTILLNKGKNMIKRIPYYDIDDPTLFVGYITGHENNSLSESRGEERTTTKQLLVNYATIFDKMHNLSLLAGYEDYYAFSESLGSSSSMMELSNFPYLDRSNNNYLASSGNASENAYRSYFGRVNYDFAHRYLFQANIRIDQSSRFHRDYRTGYFPSVSAGWVVSEESFFKKLDLPLSFLKLRGSWGNLGNERIGNYPYQANIGFEALAFVNTTGGVDAATSAAQQTYNVQDITWEWTEVFDVGLDANLFNDRFSVTFDWYKKTTHDMLLALEIPDLLGYDNPQQNAGIMNTKGWDLQVGWKDKISDFRYSISANLSDYRSVMGNLSGIVFDGNTIIREGSEYAEWYGYLSDGLFLTQEDLDVSPVLHSSVKVGDVKYKDVSGPDGVPDGKISSDYDRVLLGGSLPRYIYGGNINAGYKGFDMSLVFQGVGKVKKLLTADMVYRTTGAHTFPSILDGNYFSYYNTDEQNAKAKYPRLSTMGYETTNYKMSDYWLIDGSYFRLKNITLGYTLPKKIVNRAQLSNVRLWASASDLFSIDNYPKGWDPETAINAYITRSFNFGIQVKF